MLTPTTYQLVRYGRVHYLFWAVFLGALGIFLFAGLFSDEARAQGNGWPVYVFVGLVVSLWLGFAGYCALRAFKPPTRVVVDVEGFSYEGIFKTIYMSWKSISTARWRYDRGGFEWLEFEVVQSEKGSRRIKLDFSGLRPNKLDFLRQVRALAPWIEIK